MKKILIIQMNRMGDVVNTLPLAKQLKEDDPENEITLLCYEEFSHLLVGLSFIDRLVRIGIGEIGKLAADPSLKPELMEGFDQLINLGYSDDAARLGRDLKAKEKYGRILSVKNEVRLLGDWMKYFFAFIHHRTDNLFHMADLFTRTAGLANRPVSHYLEPDREQEPVVDALLKEHDHQPQDRLVAFQMGASEPIRAWEIEKFAELGRQVIKNKNVRLVLIGSPDEKELGERFLSLLDYPVINLIGRTEITALPVLLKKCELLISNDTGPTHIAAAVGTQVLGITFASAYFAETGSYGEGQTAMQAELPCTPCTDYSTCKHMECKQVITADMVARVAETLLNETPPAENSVESPVFDFPNVAVYRSMFLENGSVIFAPFPGNKASRLYQNGLLHRIMWDDDVKVYLDFIERELPGLRKAPEFRELLHRNLEELKQMRLLFALGVATCNNLLAEFTKPSVSPENINSAVQSLGIIESYMDQRQEPLVVLKHFFSFEMMDMEHPQLPELAVILKEKYLKLQGMADRFRANLDALSAFLGSI